MLLKSNHKGSLQNQGLISLVFSEVAEIAVHDSAILATSENTRDVYNP